MASAPVPPKPQTVYGQGDGGLVPIGYIPPGSTLPQYWGTPPGADTGAGAAVAPKWVGSIGQVQSGNFVPVVYGQQRLAGNILYFVGTNPAHGYGLAVLCDGEISSIDTVFVCDQATASTGGTNEGDRDFTKYCGASGDAVPSTYWPSGTYDLSGWATPVKPAYIKFDFYGWWSGNGDEWWTFINGLQSGSGSLTIAADVHGRKVYDPRTGLTAYSNNPALVYADLLVTYGKVPTGSIDWTAIANAANICDAAGFTCNITFTSQSSLDNALTSVLQTCCGIRIVSAGKIGMWIDVANAADPSMTLLEESGQISGVTYQWLNTSTRPTQLIVQFMNATLRPAHPAWVKGGISHAGGGVVSWASDTFEVDDPGLAGGTVPLRSTTLQLPGCSSQAQAQVLGTYYFNLAAISLRLHGTVAFQGVLLQRGMKVHITTLAGVDADFLVEQVDEGQDGLYPVILRPYESALYSLTPIVVGPPVVVDGPDPTDTPDDVTGATEVDTTAITTHTPTQKTTTSYAGVNYGLPTSYPWAKQLRIRAMADPSSTVRDAATWASMANSEIVVPLIGNLPPVGSGVYAAQMTGVVVGADVIGYNALGDTISEVVSRSYSRIIVRLENLSGTLSAGVTLDAAAYSSTSTPLPPGQPALVTQVVINAAPLPAISGPTQAILVVDEADGKMKASVEGTPYDTLLKVITPPTPAALPYVDLPNQVLGGPVQAWDSIVYGAGLFVAVAETGGAECVMTSPDGVTWTLRTTPTTTNPGWYGVAWSGSLFVIIGLYANKVLTSPDGITWTLRTAQTGAWDAIAYGAGLFVAIASADNHVMTSPDGTTWTKRSTPSAQQWLSVAWSGSLFVTVGNGTSNANCVMTSPDGITWTLRACPTQAAWASVTYGASLFVAVANNGAAGHRVMTSPDGIAWTARTSAADDPWISVLYGGTTFVALSQGGDVMTSSDGITWTLRTGPGTNSSQLAYGASTFVALGTGYPTLDAYVATSPDGITWTARTGPGTGVALSPANTLRVISSSGALYASYNGGAYGPIGGSLATKEVPTGACNGTNVTFTMAEALASGDLVFVDGVLDPAASGVGTTLTTSIPPGPDGGVLVARVTGSGSGGGGGGSSSPLMTKGDLHGYSVADARLPVGADGKVVAADSTQALGVAYKGGLVQIARIVTSGSQPSVDFSSIPANFNDLIVVFQARSNVAANYEQMSLKVNGDGASGNYSVDEYVQAVGVNPSGGYISPTSAGLAVAAISGATAAANFAASGEVKIANYLGGFYKRALVITGYTAAGFTSNEIPILTNGVWKSTAAINELTFSVPTSFVDGSVFVLYGVGSP